MKDRANCCRNNHSAVKLMTKAVAAHPRYLRKCLELLRRDEGERALREFVESNDRYADVPGLWEYDMRTTMAELALATSSGVGAGAPGRGKDNSWSRAFQGAKQQNAELNIDRLVEVTRFTAGIPGQHNSQP